MPRVHRRLRVPKLFVAALEPRHAPANVWLDAAGNLVVAPGPGRVDDIRIQLVGSDLQVTDSDPANTFVTTIPGSAGSGTNVVKVPAAAVTGSQLQFTTDDLDDTLTVDFSGGRFGQAIVFDGGSAGADRLMLTAAASTFQQNTYTLTGTGAGRLALDPDGPSGLPADSVSYAAVEFVSNDALPADVMFHLPAAASQAALGDDGATGNGMSRLDAPAGGFARTDFANPSTSLAVFGGPANDTITLNALPDFSRRLTVDAGGGADTVTVAQNLSTTAELALAGENLRLQADVTTAGSQTYNGPVTVAGVRTLSANPGSVVINGATGADAPNADELLVSAAADVVLAGAVGVPGRLGRLAVTSGGPTRLGGNIQTDRSSGRTGAVTIAAAGGVVLTATVTIDTESGNASAGIVDLGTTSLSALVPGLDLTINTGTATGAAGWIALPQLNNAAGAFLNDLTLDTDGATADESIRLNGDLRLDNLGADAGELTVVDAFTQGNLVVIGTSVLIDTEQGDDGPGGAVTFGRSRTYAKAAGANLTVDSSTAGPGQSAGSITFASFPNVGGTPLTSLTATAQGGAGGNDGDVSFTNRVNLDGGGDLTVVGRTIALATGDADIALKGAGGANLTASRNFRAVQNSYLGSQNGPIVISTNQQAVPAAGTFFGVHLNGAGVGSVNGAVTVLGRGGNSGSAQFGVFVSVGSVIESETGPVTVTGQGGASTANDCGVVVSTNSAWIRSGSGNVTVSGTGGGSTGGGNAGVVLRVGGKISSTGKGAVAVNGTGGTAPAGAGNAGVFLDGTFDGAEIRSAGGTATVTGLGGGSGAGPGVQLTYLARIAAEGSGSVSVFGKGAAGPGDGSAGVALNDSAAITTAGGAISVTGHGGGTGAAGSCAGFSAFGGGNLSATGIGLVTVIGVGGPATGPANHGIFIGAGGLVSGNGGVSAAATAGTGAAFGVATDFGGKWIGGNALDLAADSMSLGGNVLAATQVTFRPRTAGTAVGLGVADAPGRLGLTDAELDAVTGGTLQVGDATAGPVTVFSPITRAAQTLVRVVSGSDILFQGGSILTGGGPLSLAPGPNGSVSPATTGADAVASVTTLAAGGRLALAIDGTVADTSHDQLNVQGGLDLTGVNLALNGAHAPAVGDTFVIVANDGVDPITGTFSGLPEGARVSFGGASLAVTYKGGTGNDVALTAVPARVASVTVNDGSAQRSRVTSLTITFDSKVVLPANAADAFALARKSDGATVGLVAAVTEAPTTSVTLTFTAGPVEAGSLADGRYTLTVFADQVSASGASLDGNGDGTPGDDFVLVGDPATNKLFRLFGDADGDGDVDVQDFGAFRAAFGAAGLAFDADGDGDTDVADFSAFRARFSATV